MVYFDGFVVFKGNLLDLFVFCNPTMSLEGWIFKRRGKGVYDAWKSRYFRQIESKVFYFNKKEDILDSNLGFIDMKLGLLLFLFSFPLLMDLMFSNFC
jgi:hypothetical protein